MMLGRLLRFVARRKDAEILHVVERAACSPLTIARQLNRQLGGVVARARHLLAHLSYPFELFLQERLGHNRFNS